MTVPALLIALLLTGIALALVPVDPTIKKLILVIVVVIALFWLLEALGVLPAVRFR